jgi:hypothetical protein
MAGQGGAGGRAVGGGQGGADVVQRAAVGRGATGAGHGTGRAGGWAVRRALLPRGPIRKHRYAIRGHWAATWVGARRADQLTGIVAVRFAEDRADTTIQG